ncbi:PilZ domain-containing protein [Desulfogranum marinum]|uniref:PilZ domain-containing protein n=1 Tax=Desulfogranum marinum TaxID=453220 RepID=UPI0029C709D2|nr:PilZ domain-containing protein [Desulfogranum marinum]
MAGRTKNCDVKGGRIRVVCSRCKSIKYVTVSSSFRRKQVRCKCGKVASYILNHRGFMRESLSGQAMVNIGGYNELRVQLNDISLGGIGFAVRPGQTRRMRLGQEVTVKYRSASGAAVQRKIRLTSMAGMRVGGEFIDSLASLNKRTF